jgi:N-acetylmuramoyl-L-alanine amidase
VDTVANEARARLSNIRRHRLGTAPPTCLLGGRLAEAAPTKNSAQEKCDRGQFRILVDVGHTAEIPGAMSARGVPEYEFNLKLARAIERELSGAGFRSTLVLITGGATFAGLVSRVKRANEWPADLFLSIHHDSVPARFLDGPCHASAPHQTANNRNKKHQSSS